MQLYCTICTTYNVVRVGMGRTQRRRHARRCATAVGAVALHPKPKGTRTDEAMQAEEARAFHMMGIATSKQENDQQSRSRALSGAAPEAMDPTDDSTWRDVRRLGCDVN